MAETLAADGNSYNNPLCYTAVHYRDFCIVPGFAAKADDDTNSRSMLLRVDSKWQPNC